MPSTQQSLSRLLHILNDAIENEQFYHLPQGTHLHHCGVYSNAASIWFADSSLLDQQSGRFEVTAAPNQELLLIIIKDSQWHELHHQMERENVNTLLVQEQLCQLLNVSNIQLPEALQGIEWQAGKEAGNPSYLLFHPLHSLQLFDIHDRLS